MIVYQDLIDSIYPLSYYAKACRVVDYEPWKVDCIPQSCYKKIQKIFAQEKIVLDGLASVTYQDLSATGYPLSFFAKVCKVQDIFKWKGRGIPEKFQIPLKRIFVKKINSLTHKCESSQNAANGSVRKSAFSPLKINHLTPQAGLNSAQNLGKQLNNPKALQNNDLGWLGLLPITDEQADIYDARFLKYLRQNAARSLQPKERVARCMRKEMKTGIDVSIKKPLNGSAYFCDLFICGSLWRCPVCAAKITEKRRQEGLLATAMQRKLFGDDSALLVTFTYPHHREDVLAILIEKQKAAFKWLFDDCWAFRDLCDKYAYMGNIRSLEVTHGENNGWHPHVHYIFFFEQNFKQDLDADWSLNPSAAGMDAFKKELYPLWQQACSRAGLGEPSFQHGLDVRGGAYAAEYVLKFGLDDYEGILGTATNSRFLDALENATISGNEVTVNVTRWGMEDEVFKFASKGGRVIDGKSSRSPFQLLDGYIAGDKRSGQLFIEYADAFKGFRQSRWSKGLKKRFKYHYLVDDYSKGDINAKFFFNFLRNVDTDDNTEHLFLLLNECIAGRNRYSELFACLDVYIGHYTEQQLIEGKLVKVKVAKNQQAQDIFEKWLKQRGQLLQDMTDEQAARFDDKTARLFATISFEDWQIICDKGQFKRDIRSRLLMFADMGDLKKFWAYVAWLCGRELLHYQDKILEQADFSELDAYLPLVQLPEDISPESFPSSALPEFESLAPSESVDFEKIEVQEQNSIFSFAAHDCKTAIKPFFGLPPEQVLQDVFGYSEFRSFQADVINHVIDGGSGLVLMPTGGGKSLCYQIPMLCRSGVGVVVSPLIALMQDQVNALRAKGVRAAFINSTLTPKKINQIEQQVLAGEVDILYLAPERLKQDSTLKFLSVLEISAFAIDEAHCISQWGHDFRRSYLCVSVIKKYFPHVPRIALTATANKETCLDIIKIVGLENTQVFKTSFDRPNIDYQVLESKTLEQTKRLVLDFVKQRAGQAGIIYSSSKQRLNDLVELLNESGCDALPYHASLTPKQKRENLTAFIDRPVVMVATTAFGMGIDKADVRYVLHLDLSDSIEAFYQESGRAGRDGLPAESIVIYNPSSFKYRSVHKSLSELRKFEAVRDYCELKTCRRSYLLNFFI